MSKIREPYRHHSTLNAFASIVTLLEGGLIYDSDAQKTADKIVALCQSETGKQLRKFDIARKKQLRALDKD